MRKTSKNNKYKISAPKCNEKSELPDWSYSVSDIQDYFQYIIKTWSSEREPSNKDISKKDYI